LGFLLLGSPAALQAQFEYTTNAGAISITNYTGDGGAVIIPASTNGLPVTSIGAEAFYGSFVTGVTIPDSVTSIGAEAFYGCGELIGITIPASVASIGTEAFGLCVNMTEIAVAPENTNYSSLHGVLLDKSQGTLIEYPGGLAGSYTIPDSVTNIAAAAFEGCASLTAVTIPAGVTSIGEDVFANCYNMTSVTIPASVVNIGDQAFFGCNELASATISEGVTNIGDQAFYACYALASVTIPGSAASIGTGAFAWCIGLKEITVEGQNAFYSSVNGVLFDKRQAALVAYPGGLGGSYTIPDTVTSIQASAFEGCDTLTNVTMPFSVNSIGEDAFAYCYDLASAAIPDSVTNIGADAYYGCGDLTSVTISDGVTDLGEDAFYGCSGLTSITIPASVTNMGEGTFEYCVQLTNIYFKGDAPAADSSVFAHDNGPLTAFYLPGATGWSSTFDGLPAVLWNAFIQAADGSFGVRNNQFGFNLTGASNISIVVEACTNLANPVWTPLQTLVLSNGLFYFSDPQWTNYPARFYRLSSP
jgi:hypothetical protein